MSSEYTDKVLEHFRNPHNMGKIENPDGIGKVGNPVCLEGEGFLHTNCKVKRIKEFSSGDKVINHSGFYSMVNKIVWHNYKGEVLAIKNRLGQVLLTPEHLVLAKKVPLEKDKFRRTKGKQKLPYGWYHVSELEKGDIVLYPIFKEVKDKKCIGLDVSRSKFDYKSKNISKIIPLSPSFLRLCGYYLAEGSLNDQTTKRHLMFTFNINEVDCIEDVKRIVRDLWGLKVYVKRIEKRKTVHLTINNTFLVKFFKKHFGKGAENKAIPHFIMLLPPRKQINLIYGLWKGDGYVNLDVPRARYATISRQLASQLKLLLLRQKIIPSLYIEKEKTINNVKHKRSYRFNVGDRRSLMNLFRILGIKYKFSSFIRKKVWADEDFAYLPITSIEQRRYNSRVYNLEVEQSRSFLTDSLCVHNCGDVMWIYIKVKNGTIVDCKFETFGCVAAIATSSILTDLAKGKTIEEAAKLSNKDVVNELGGLPSVKMHCSVLAEEGIKKAIDDYLSRKSEGQRNEGNS